MYKAQDDQCASLLTRSTKRVGGVGKENNPQGSRIGLRL
jgi:hypothetical protein